MGAHMAMCCKRSALGPQHMCVYMGLCVCVCVCLKVCVHCHGNKKAGCPPSFQVSVYQWSRPVLDTQAQRKENQIQEPLKWKPFDEP